MPNEMWWQPEILLAKPTEETMRDPKGYAQMFGIVAKDFSDEVYCETCADEVVRRVGERAHHSDGTKIQVWVRDEGVCHSCGSYFVAERPDFVPVWTDGARDLNTREYVEGFGKFTGDGTYTTYCTRCGPKQRRPESDTKTMMHRIWLRQTYRCVECGSHMSPAVETVEGNEVAQNEEPSPKNDAPHTRDHRGELLSYAGSARVVVDQFLWALDNSVTHRRESEKRYSHVHLFKDLRKNAALPMIREQDAEDIASDLQHRFEEALEETRDAEKALESAHEQLGRVVENIVYHVAIMCLQNGVGSFTKLMPVWIDEAVERAVMEHDAENGEAD